MKNRLHSNILLFLCLFAFHNWSYAQEGALDGEYFGAKLAAGDFDNNGIQDLIIGVPGDEEDGFLGAGGFHVLYGTPAGLTHVDNQFWGQLILGATPEKNEFFGASFAVGRFNDDDYDDLAVGNPYDSEKGSQAHGAVHVIYGSATGLSAFNAQIIYQGGDFQEQPELRDNFGFALVAGDFDGNGYDDLAISAPGESVHGNVRLQGVVHIIWGDVEGLSGTNDFLLYQSLPQLEGTKSEVDDRFGWALNSGDYNGDGYADLAVGTPFEHTFRLDPEGGEPYSSNGIVEVFYGHITGNLTLHWQHFFQGKQGIAGSLDGGLMGSTLASGDLNGDGYDELVISSPWENEETQANSVENRAGAVHIFYGSSTELNTHYTDQFFNQGELSASLEPSTDAYFGGLDYSEVNIADNNNYIGTQTLATGDIDGDFIDDLFIGVPGSFWTQDDDNHSLIHLVYGNDPSVIPENSELWKRNDLTPVDYLPSFIGAYSFDVAHFGAAVISADFNGDDCKDVAIGSRQDMIDTVEYITYPGLVYIMYNGKIAGNCLGLSVGSTQIWSQLSPGIFPGKADFDTDELILLGSESAVSPQKISLSQNYPNPFNPSTEIAFSLPADQHVNLVVYNMLGREIATLANQVFTAGSHTVSWDAGNHPTGMYFYRFNAGDFSESRLMALTK